MSVYVTSDTVYVQEYSFIPSVYFISQENKYLQSCSVYVQVYVPRVQSLSQEYILCFPRCINYLVSAQFYVPSVQSISQEYILYPKRINLCPKCLQFMSQDLVYMCISQENKLYCKCSVYVPSVQSISQEYNLCPKIAVYVPRLQFMSQWFSLCPKSTVFIPRVHFISQDKLSSKCSVYVPSNLQSLSQEVHKFIFKSAYLVCSRVQYFIPRVHLCPSRVLNLCPIYSHCPKSPFYIYVPRLQFMSQVYSMYQEYSLYPKSTYVPRFYIPRVQFMSQDCSYVTKISVYVPRVQSLSQEYILFL